MKVQRENGRPLLLTVPETAETLRISVRSCWRLLALGELQRVRVGRTTRVVAASLEQFIARGGYSGS